MLLRMEAIMVDKAEPSESLTCNTVYSIDADGFDVLTSSMQLDAFRHGGCHYFGVSGSAPVNHCNFTHHLFLL